MTREFEFYLTFTPISDVPESTAGRRRHVHRLSQAILSQPAGASRAQRGEAEMARQVR